MSARIGVGEDAAFVVGEDSPAPAELESVFTLRAVAADGTDVADADPLAGYLAPAGVVVQQVREVPRDESSAVWFPSLPSDPAPDGDQNSVSGDVLAALGTTLADAAPDGWSWLSVECEALVSRMDVTVTVTMADGSARHWSPPAMVSQWLHRLRMCDFHPSRGVWCRARFELSPSTPLVRDVDALTAPSFLTTEDGADELRLLPRNADAVPGWLLDAAVHSAQATLSGYAGDQESGSLELVRLFDGHDDAGRPAWYRPVLDERERQAVLAYLEGAPLVLSSRGMTRDELAGTEEPVVGMGFHTDGRYVWPTAAGYYLREHGVPPALPLVEHIRAARHRLPVTIPAITMDRAAALAMGRPWDEPSVDAAANKALGPVESVIIDKRISPRHYSVFAEREGAWCLVRDDDRYRVQWSLDRRSAVLFDDVRQAAAYLAGQLSANADDLAYELGEEIPAWQSPLVVLSDDPPVESFASVTTAVVEDIEVDRYGDPDGNLVFVADTPFDQRGLPEPYAERPYHRYRIGGERWQVVAVVSADGGHGYVLPKAISEYLRSGHLEEITPSNHPGLPPITDAMRAEAARNPGGWLYCADPDADPRFIAGMPLPILLGGYKVGDDGQLTGETYVNEDYRPSPRRRGYPEPQTEFEVVLGYVAAGWLPHERILSAAVNATFLLETDGTGGLRAGVDNNGRGFIAVYSSPRYVPQDTQSVMQTQGRELTSALADLTLIVNPGANFGIELPGNDLIRAASDNQPA